MKARPPIGTEHELRFVVAPEHTIEFAGDGMPAVLATPRLIGLLERAARLALVPMLDGGERSVGVEIELRHLSPTLLGAEVTCVARVIGVEGKFVTYHLEARVGRELIARGLHKRAVIQVESFARRLSSKTFS